MNTTLHVIGDIIIPFVCGIFYFLLAKYVKFIAPMRKLVTGDITYRGAYWGFIFFGIYLMTRPLQILLGPHPMPLIINNVREFFMIGLFAPAVFIGLASFALGHKKIHKPLVISMFTMGLILAVLFIIMNIRTIGGSMKIFAIKGYAVYDGRWFHPSNPNVDLMPALFIIRLISPVLIMMVAGTIAFWRSFTYPPTTIYTNMRKKLFFQGLAVWSYGFSMLFCGFMFVFWKIPNQWWMYYVGALGAGVFEAVSLRFPLHKT
ncbi:MAG: hypothetical protein ABH868_06515 [bacterium]